MYICIEQKEQTMARRRTYKTREKLSTGWVVFGVVTIIVWVSLFLAPVWMPAFGIK